jgi:hypothetical protein
MLEGKAGEVRAVARNVTAANADIEVEVPLIDPLRRIRSVTVHYLRSDLAPNNPQPGKAGTWPELAGAQSVALRLDGPRAVGRFAVPAADRDKSITFQTSFVDDVGRRVYTKPFPMRVASDTPPVVAQRPRVPAEKGPVIRGPVNFPPPVPAVVKPPDLEQEKVVRTLPAPLDEVAVGGGGRYLILRLPRLRQLAVFDVNEAKVVKFLPIPGDDVKFAAGMDKLVVIEPTSYRIHRWSLTTFEREATASLSMKVPPIAVAMGSASSGPLVISGVNYPLLGETVFFDVHRMARIEIPNPHDFFRTSPSVFLRASADGRVFACQETSPHGMLQSCIWARGNVQKYGGGGSGLPVPGPDGQFIYTTQGVYTPDLKQVSATGTHCLPALHGPYYLSLSGRDRQAGQQVGISLHLRGETRPLARLPDVEGVGAQGPGGRGGLPLDRRIHLLPRAKVLITIPERNDRLILHRFDVERALEQSDLDYLVVVSGPPPARAGQPFTYRLDIRSKRGGVKVKLESGPKGLQVTPDGQVSWAVPAQPAEPEAEVLLTLRDTSGQEAFHTFRIEIAGR